ncbi:tRNA uridine-5-carboxymethylaminomethyl(34) synthesis GTPase MnmE [uncultured Eubacterium sp.]|uniref:tRNA uridine-5-carboxymethylaminomethyl(34) synthesis GTPase MnmE n=1 Tax=uncultured Eubacterium sp. TaxID=165185 RepID=UPI000E965C22|nr:tRNA uridine-5-carboxymethylaminomethyl(34) synthesis GTPase MnmE [uncultured Eubacterium sp.]HAV90253.1 tRNA uridine-5-carboxymethylaminomethyl(34) synthesis GTPase MnmE [Eubacterium sp.]
MKITDTIAAIATAVNNQGIGVIRISGEESFEVADKIIKLKNGKTIKESPSHTINYGFVYDGEEMIDEVMVSIMKAPRTYTREDVVEINCHGGVLVVKKVLSLVLKNGARLAGSGEFTKRAFLNGRIDLSQAEAIMDLINAKSELALEVSVGNLEGRISEKIKKLREVLIYHIAFIEAALDDPEHIEIDGYSETLKGAVIEVKDEVKKLIESADDGRIISEGIKTVILGKPNVGKSSLLNRLSGRDRAIVTDIAGTTRDTLEESINIKGLRLNIVDTAGIRDTEDVVEKIGVERALETSDDADLIIFVVDSSVELDDNDKKILGHIKDKKAIIVLNKSDLDTVVTEEVIKSYVDKKVITTSALVDSDVTEITDCIYDMFANGLINFNDQVYITNIRQKDALIQADESLSKVLESIELNMPEDFFSIDIMDAYERLGDVIGQSLGEDLVDEIFSKFCMGK